MTTIHFETKLMTIGSWTILLLPKSESEKLPSRGMTVVEGMINGASFHSTLEPDGRGSHWLRVSDKMLKAIQAEVGDTVTLAIESSDQWPEPEVPVDLKKALDFTPKAHTLWKDVTPNARWDWIRWISATKNPETRKKRIGVALSKLTSGMRRPCCFNRSMCCEPSVSNNGILLT